MILNLNNWLETTSGVGLYIPIGSSLCPVYKGFMAPFQIGVYLAHVAARRVYSTRHYQASSSQIFSPTEKEYKLLKLEKPTVLISFPETIQGYFGFLFEL